MGYVPGRFDREGAEHMDRIAKTVFAPVYPVLAEQILIRCGFSRGRCLDVGSGPGSLGIALAQASDHDIPRPVGSVVLVGCRGSVVFWEDLSRAFSEIYRVLAPGGRTYVGGGFGTAELRDAVAAAMTKENADWKSFRDKNLGPDNRERVAGVLADLGLHHRIINDDSGLWVVIERGR